jgi:hypothetical protein
VQKVIGYAAGIAAGAVSTLAAVFAWYVWEYIQRHRLGLSGRKENGMRHQDEPESGGTKLFDKINHVLTETRVVIPGAQALLGFQLIAVMTEGFDKLSRSSKYAHLVSLGLIAASTILLMTPAAYHRIVEQGEVSQRLWRHSRRMLMAGMATLAAGVAGDFYVVVRKVAGSVPLATALAVVLLLMFYAAWFGYTLWQRARLHTEEPAPKEMAAVA